MGEETGKSRQLGKNVRIKSVGVNSCTVGRSAQSRPAPGQDFSFLTFTLFRRRSKLGVCAPQRRNLFPRLASAPILPPDPYLASGPYLAPRPLSCLRHLSCPSLTRLSLLRPQLPTPLAHTRFSISRSTARHTANSHGLRRSSSLSAPGLDK